MYIEGKNNKIYKFGELVNKTTKINETKISKDTGYLMRESHYNALSPDEKQKFLNIVRNRKTISPDKSNLSSNNSSEIK